MILLLLLWYDYSSFIIIVSYSWQVIQTQLGPHHFSNSDMPRPDNYIVLAMFTLLCCMCWPALFCAVIAMIYSLQVYHYY